MLHPINPLRRRMDNPISLEGVYATCPADVAMTDLTENEVLVLDHASGEHLQLTRMGARMWSLLNEVKALRTVIDTLLEEYDVTPEQVTADVADIFSELESRGLIQVSAIANK